VTFTLLAAVDVADGRAVRLVQGEADTAVAHGSARDTALAWQAAGAEWIHLVDLDAAYGRGSNAEMLAAVIGELDVEVQLSGGISDDASLERALSTGCARVNLSTAALEDPAWCARAIDANRSRVAVGLDVRVFEHSDGARQHRLAARGSTRDVGDLWETLAQLDEAGCVRYVVTDVSRDGTLGGPDVELYRAVTLATDAAVIASGGISAISDLVMLAEAAATGSNLEGSIVGRALYAGRFTLPEALEAVRRVGPARVHSSS
jgi:phosphoribosylanthranilate isomerase